MGEPSTRRAGTGPRALALTVALLSLSSRADAFFRNLMIGQLAAARIDPIVKPGGPSQHCHHLNGGSNLGFDATGETLAASNCTNSMITQDKSTYWTPWMYFQHDNGSFESVDLALGVTAYYKYEARPGTEGKTIQPFPKDFRMLSGDSNKRTWNGPWPVPPTSQWGKDDTTQDALAEKALGFNCMHYYNGEAAEGSFQYPWLRNKEFIDANCPQGIRAEVLFPSCWDGENNDSENHKDHTAFPAGLDAGKCPDTHPVYLPILFYETIWNTQTFAGVPGQFVMANGDPTGMGYHGDFLASWPEGLQEQIRDNPACTGPQSDGQMSSCPLFDITDQSTARSCKLEMPEVLQDEMTTGVIDALPGNVKVSGSQHDPGSPQGPIASFTSAVASFVTGFPGIGPTGVASPSSTSTPMGVPGLNPTTTGFATGSATMPTIDPATVPAVTQAAPNLVNTNVAANQGGSTSYTTYTSAGYVVEMAIIETVEVITTTIHPTNVVTAVVTSTAEAAPADQFKKWDSKHAQRHARDIKKHAHGVHNHHF